MFETVTQWATILSPILAIILAWWTSRSGARDTAKLIKCSKKLMLINLQIKILELSKEAKEEHINFKHISNKSKKLSEEYNSNNMTWTDQDYSRFDEKKHDLDDKSDYTFDKRTVIIDAMNELIMLIKEVEKL